MCRPWEVSSAEWPVVVDVVSGTGIRSHTLARIQLIEIAVVNVWEELEEWRDDMVRVLPTVVFRLTEGGALTQV